MINLRDHKVWDSQNGTLSVSLNPKGKDVDNGLYVLLNGSTGNLCLDYKDDEFNPDIAKQRAWSSDTGYYIKISSDDTIHLLRWWDGIEELIPYKRVQEDPQRFYQAVTKYTPDVTSSIVAFAKATFIKLRNCIQQSDNGQISLRTFMFLLAALEDRVKSAKNVDLKKWHLKEFDSSWITEDNWSWIYQAFNKGANNIIPDIKLVLRHASNKLFQEAHREATRGDFQISLFGDTKRKYDSGISDGAFYTPTALVRTIVQEALWSLNRAKPISERPKLRIIDPACGSAEFLREALRQLKIIGYIGEIEMVGWDISEISCEISEFVLQYENNTEWSGKVKIEIVKNDSLESNWSTQGFFDIVLMNPPYISFDNLGNRKDLVLKQLDNLVTRQPDLSAVFLKKAVELTSNYGVLGLVLPQSLVMAETYTNLRNYIKEEQKIDLSLISRLGSAGLFEKAMIIPSVIVGVKGIRSSVHTNLWTDHQQTSVFTALRKLRIYRNQDIPVPVVRFNYSIYENEALTKNNSWRLNSYQVFQLSEKLKEFGTVKKLFKITRGVDSGNNAAFILNKKEWLSLTKSERSYFRPTIMRDSIIKGQLNDNLYLFYPYDEKIIRSEKQLKDKLPTYYKNWLSVNKEKLKSRNNFEEKWWELSRPRSFHNRQKLVSSYFGKSGYFAFDKKGEFVVGQSFAWLPLIKELDKEDYYFAYLALLHSPLVDKLLAMVSVNVAGGQFDLSKRYIDNMPLPDLRKADSSILENLNSFGKKIHEGIEIDKNVLNEVVANSYGLNLTNFNFD